MYALAFDTSNERIVIGLGRLQVAGKLDLSQIEFVAQRSIAAHRASNQKLLPEIDALLKENGVSPCDLAVIGCGRGPGSFTGVRIALATAKGICSALKIPLVGISTLDAVAQNAAMNGYHGDLLVLADAMRGEVYPVHYHIKAGGPRAVSFKRLNADMVCKPGDVQVDCPVCGDGLVKFGAMFEDRLDESFWYPTGKSLLALMQFGTPVYAGEVLPVYTRLSDAEETEIKNKDVKKDLKTGVQGDVSFTLCGAADETEIVALESQCFGSDAWKSFDGRGYWLKATVDGKLIGYAGGTYDSEVIEILKVCVAPGHRGRGIAKKLLSDVLEAMRNLNVSRAMLEVRQSNSSAIALYEKLGFKRIAERKNFYGNESAYSYELDLTNFRAQEDFVYESGTQEKAMSKPLIFAIESSCDETAASIVGGDDAIVSSVVSSSAKFHARFGGVVPEIASRKHIECISYVADDALRQAGLSDCSSIDAIAVTAYPGLVGSLVVGCAFAKGIAWAANKPLIFVDHLVGHLFANKMCSENIEFPCVASLISGGNTMLVLVREWGDYEVIGGTIDDAVGEAFDKVARAFGLPYPGGPEISALAKEGDAQKIDLPRPMLHSHDLRMSLSGLKTAVMLEIEKLEAKNEKESGDKTLTRAQMADVCAAFEESITDVQVAKAKDAIMQCGAKTFCFGGGVAANARLRDGYEKMCKKLGVAFDVAPLNLCGDNAAMIGLAAQFEYRNGNFVTLEGDVSAKSSLNSRA